MNEWRGEEGERRPAARARGMVLALAALLVAGLAVPPAAGAPTAQEPPPSGPPAETTPQAEAEGEGEGESQEPLLDLSALAAEDPGADLGVDLRATTLQGLPAGMAAMILGGRQGGQVTLVPLAVPVVLPAGGGAGRAAVALLVEVDGPSLFGPNPQPVTEVQFFAYALTADDAVAGFLSQTVTLDLTELGEAVFTGGLKFAGHLELPPGDYTLRVLVHEPGSQRFGLSRIEVSVPRRAALLTPLVEESEEAPWLMVGEAPHGDMGALDLGRVLELAGTPLPSALPLLRGREVPMDVLLYGAAGSRFPEFLQIQVEGGEGKPAGPLTGQVVSRQETGLPGLERLRVSVSIHTLETGSYRLRLAAADLNGAAATSPPLPVVVLQGADTANLWTDIQRRLSGDAVVSLDMSEVDARRRGRQRRAREAVAGAYRQVLMRLANGERDAALDNLMQIEQEVIDSGQEQPMALLDEAESLVLQMLSYADPQALLPVMMLHGRAYDRYLERLALGLSTHSREKAIAITELYASSVEATWGRRISDRGDDRLRAQAEEEIAAARRLASRALATFGAYLQSAQVRMAGRALLRRALELDAENPSALIHLAAGLEKTGDYAESVNVLRELISLDPKSPEGRLRLAVNLRRLEREQESMQVLRNLVAEDNPDWVLAVAYQELAMMQLRRGDAGAAVATLDQAVGRLPGEDRLLIELAYALDRAGDTARARSVVLRLEPESAGGSRVRVVDAGPGFEPAEPEPEEEAVLLGSVRGDGEDPGSPRHRYNSWPSTDLAASGSSLNQAAMARLTSLGNALAAMPGVATLEDGGNRRREDR